MPDEAEHAERARQNRALVDGPPALIMASPHWAVTVAFYAAIHLVEQLAARDGKHHARHVGMASREKYLQFHRKHRVLAPDLFALYSASLLARYEASAALINAFPGSTIQSQLIDGCLARIETHVAATP